MKRTAPYPSSLIGLGRREQIARIGDPYVAIVAADLASRPASSICRLWDELMPSDWTGEDALAALAERLVAPVRLAHKVLRQQLGRHSDAAAQLLQVLDLSPAGEQTEPPRWMLSEAVAHLRELELRETIATLEGLAVHRG